MRISRILIFITIAAVFLGIVLPAVSSEGKVPKKFTETITAKNGDKISFDMVLIPEGSFMMGSPENEAGRKDHEGPRHEVKLDAFYLCTTETTIELFMSYYQETVTAKKGFDAMEQEKKAGDENSVDAITGPTPVYGDMTMGYGKTNPAIGATWHNAMTFCKWLSLKTGKKYRLPTEAEWEYACRAGTTGAYGAVDDVEKIGEIARFEDNADGETGAVGEKKPNPWGLHDMQGNVAEWVFDFYSPQAYAEAAKTSPAVNPKGPKEGDIHVARGGDHTSAVEGLRCASRLFEEPWWRSGDPQFPKSIWWLPEMDFIGFRVACTVDKQEK